MCHLQAQSYELSMWEMDILSGLQADIVSLISYAEKTKRVGRGGIVCTCGGWRGYGVHMWWVEGVWCAHVVGMVCTCGGWRGYGVHMWWVWCAHVVGMVCTCGGYGVHMWWVDVCRHVMCEDHLFHFRCLIVTKQCVTRLMSLP